MRKLVRAGSAGARPRPPPLKSHLPHPEAGAPAGTSSSLGSSRTSTKATTSRRNPLDEHSDAVQDAVQAEDELVVGPVGGLEHPGRDERGECGEPPRVG